MASPVNPTGGDPAGGADFDISAGGDPAGGAGDFGTGVGDGGDGDGGVADFDPNSPEAQAAAEFEAEVLGDDPGAAGDGDGSPADHSELRKFVQKNYAGDENALLAGIYESRAEGRRLAEEVAALKAQIAESGAAKPRDREAEFKAARDSHHVVRTIDQEMKTIETDVKQLDTRQLEIAQTVRSLNAEVDQLEGKLSREEDPSQRAELRYSLSEKKQERRALMSEFQANDGVRRANAASYRALARDLARTEQDIRDEVEFRDQQAASKRETDQRTVADFDSSFIGILRGLDVDPKGEQARYLYRSTKEILAGELERRRGPALNTQEIHQAVTRLMDAAVKTFGIKRRAAAPAGRRPNPQQRQVRPVAPRQVLPPRGARREDPNFDDEQDRGARPAPPRNLDEALEDPDFVRRRANRVFSAQANKTARAGRGRIT